LVFWVFKGFLNLNNLGFFEAIFQPWLIFNIVCMGGLLSADIGYMKSFVKQGWTLALAENVPW